MGWGTVESLARQSNLICRGGEVEGNGDWRGVEEDFSRSGRGISSSVDLGRLHTETSSSNASVSRVEGLGEVGGEGGMHGLVRKTCGVMIHGCVVGKGDRLIALQSPRRCLPRDRIASHVRNRDIPLRALKDEDLSNDQRNATGSSQPRKLEVVSVVFVVQPKILQRGVENVWCEAPSRPTPVPERNLKGDAFAACLLLLTGQGRCHITGV